MVPEEWVDPRAHALAVAGRRWSYAAWTVVGNGLLVGSLGILAGGFVRPWLLLAGLVLVVAALGPTWRARRLGCKAGRAAGLNRYQTSRVSDWLVYPLEQLLAAHGRSRELRTVGGLGVALLGVFVTLPVVVAAHGMSHPMRTVALSAHDDACARCPGHASAWFVAADGRTVDTSLVATPNDEENDFRPGMSLVYDGRQPTRAMVASDFDWGSSMAAEIMLIASIMIECATVVWCVRTGMRRRWQLGSGRPDVAIAAISREWPRSGDVWRIRNSDGVQVDYLDQPLRLDALARRIAQDPGGFTAPPELGLETEPPDEHGPVGAGR